MYGTKLKTAPTTEPVSIEEAKAWMRVETTDDNALITALVAAARERVEEMTGRKLITQTWTLVQDRFSKYDLRLLTGTPMLQRGAIDAAGHSAREEDVRMILLPYAPVSSIDELRAVDADGTSEIFDLAANCVLDTVNEPARLVLKDAASWPTPAAGLQAVNGVEVDFKVGYGTATAVPERLKIAIKLLASHFYENREETTPLKLDTLPLGVDALLASFRLNFRGYER